MKKTIIMIVALCISCGAVRGQGGVDSQWAKQIQENEASVRSSQGRTDGVVWLQLATLYQDVARYDDAEKAYRKAADLLKRQDRTRYADALDHMGTMYAERGKFAKAEPVEQKALAIRQQSNDAVGIGVSYMHLAQIAFGKHELQHAETNAEMATSLLAPEHAAETSDRGATPEEKMSALLNIALIRCAEGECQRGTHDLERALVLANAHYPSNSLPVGFLNFLLGYAHTKSGDVQGGAELMKAGIGEMKTEMGWGHPTYIAALKEYRSVLMRAGRGEEAAEVEESIAKLTASSAHANAGSNSGVLGVNALR